MTADDGTARPQHSRSARAWWKKADDAATDVTHVVDADIDALPREARLTLAGIWQERGGSELRVAAGFAALTAQLIEHGASENVMKLVTRAVRDEAHHAEIAVDIAARYRGDEVQWPGPQPVHVPVLPPAQGRFRSSLLVIAMCCINETLACGILEGQLAQTKSVLARAGLQTVLADEIDHARAGWAHIASPHVPNDMKKDIGTWLPRLLNARLRDLTDEDSPFPGEDLPDHGILTRRARKTIVATALETVVFPGFERAGIDPKKAAEWAATAFA